MSTIEEAGGGAEAAPPPEPTLQQLTSEIASLLRFSCVVDAPNRAASDVGGKRESRRPSRTLKQVTPSMWYLNIFQGGSLPVPEGWTAQGYQAEVNRGIQAAIAPLRERALERARSIASKEAFGLAEAKELEVALSHIRHIESFGVTTQQRSLKDWCLVTTSVAVACDDVTVARLVGDQVNAYLSSLTAVPIARVRKAIQDRLASA